jgi:hypothetical protein
MYNHAVYECGSSAHSEKSIEVEKYRKKMKKTAATEDQKID